MEKTHWKALTNPDYIGSYALYDKEGVVRDLTVTIKSVARKEVTGDGGKKDTCLVAELVGQKPFIINATNAKSITAMYGSPLIQDWAGKSITLFVEKIKDKRNGGAIIDALRIRPTKPALPELTPTHKRWTAAAEALKQGNTTVAEIRKTFTLTPANEQLLKAL